MKKFFLCISSVCLLLGCSWSDTNTSSQNTMNQVSIDQKRSCEWVWWVFRDLSIKNIPSECHIYPINQDSAECKAIWGTVWCAYQADGKELCIWTCKM